MKPRVYVETTVVSYLTAWPSRDIIIAGHQKATREWWKSSRDFFDLVASELVVQEAKDGAPEAAAEDALHIAIAVTNGIEYLVTWNCRHIANATVRSRIDRFCRKAGYEPTIICTPEELLEVD